MSGRLAEWFRRQTNLGPWCLYLDVIDNLPLTFYIRLYYWQGKVCQKTVFGCHFYVVFKRTSVKCNAFNTDTCGGGSKSRPPPPPPPPPTTTTTTSERNHNSNNETRQRVTRLCIMVISKQFKVSRLKMCVDIHIFVRSIRAYYMFFMKNVDATMFPAKPCNMSSPGWCSCYTGSRFLHWIAANNFMLALLNSDITACLLYWIATSLHACFIE